jgi:hypothetical protein
VQGPIVFRPGLRPDGLSNRALDLLAGLAARSGLAEIPITSTHRDPFGNRNAGGAKASQHIFGNAVDIDVSSLNDQQKQALLEAAVASGAKGVGIYQGGRTIHLDVRENPAFWGPDPSAPYAGQPASAAPAWAQPIVQRLMAQGGGQVAPPPALDAIKGTIAAAATQFGVDPSLMLSIARRESTFNPSAANSRSSAKGLFGFIDDTWQSMSTRYGKQLGMPEGTPATDPKWAPVMAALLMRENREVVARNIGRDPTSGELYLAHFMGAGGATSMIKIKDMNPDAPAAAIFSREAVSNPTIFYDREGQPRTVSQVYASLTKLEPEAAPGGAASTAFAAGAEGVAQQPRQPEIPAYTPAPLPSAPQPLQLGRPRFGTDMEAAFAARFGEQRGLLG